MRYGGSYAPYFGNLYGPPQIVTAPPYYGPYYGAFGTPGSEFNGGYAETAPVPGARNESVTQAPVSNDHTVDGSNTTSNGEPLPTPPQ